jgi:inorganic pyrophosphatase
MKLNRVAIAVLLGIPVVLLAEATPRPSRTLPAPAKAALTASLESAARHKQHVWRDTPPYADGGLLHAYVEIPVGERRKFEFDIRANARRVDRVMPETLGGYPVNYGFVPQTVSYDGDPFDVLVLGPPLPGGQLARGVIVGLMLMEDEKGVDSKVVMAPATRGGAARYQLDAATQERIARYFREYKRHEPGKFSRVPGWATGAAGRAHVDATHAFFRQCRAARPGACRLENLPPVSRS